MGGWADTTVERDIVVGRAREFVSDRDSTTFVADSITDERIVAAKRQARTYLFGSKGGALAAYVGKIAGGMDAILDRLADAAETTDSLNELVALVFLRQIVLDRRTSAQSKWSDFADRLEMDIDMTVRMIERVGPNAISFTETTGGARSLGGAASRRYD